MHGLAVSHAEHPVAKQPEARLPEDRVQCARVTERLVIVVLRDDR